MFKNHKAMKNNDDTNEIRQQQEQQKLLHAEKLNRKVFLNFYLFFCWSQCENVTQNNGTIHMIIHSGASE